MGRNSIILLPATQRHLADLGENVRLARLRRQLSAVQVAERAGISLPTLRAIEHGDANVSIGAYASVLLCLGLDKDLALVGREDELGRKLQDAKISVGKRAPRRNLTIKKSSSDTLSKESGEAPCKDNGEAS